MYKIKHNLSESSLKDLFSVVNGNYILRSQSDFGVPVINTVFRVSIRLGILNQWYGIVLQMIWETFVIFIYLKQQYRDGNQLTVPEGCVKTTKTVLVSLLFLVNWTIQIMQVFFITFCKNKITVLITIHWEAVCEIIRNTIGESPLDKLYNHVRFFSLKQIYLSRKVLHHC